MENQSINKTKSNLGISLLAGCGTSLAAFVVPAVLIYALDIWLLPGESVFFILMICGLGVGAIMALVALIAAGVAVFRTTQPRPLAFGLLGWAGISILINIVIPGIGQLATNFIQPLAVSTTEMLNVFSIIRLIGLIILLIADVLAIVVGWLVYRRQQSKLKQG